MSPSNRGYSTMTAAGQAGLSGRHFGLFGRITESSLFNRLSGFLPAALFGVFLLAEVVGLINYLQLSESVTAIEIFVHVAASLSKIVFISLLSILFLIRKPPIKKAAGLGPRVAALVGTFMFVFVTALPAPEPTFAQSLVSLVLVCIGSGLSFYVLSHLGRSFSLMAEARELVTTGPYRFARHPLYVAEELAVLGILVQFFTLPFLCFFFLHILVQLRRIDNEERVLSRAFPEYAEYARTTDRLIPGMY
ncbi:MAG: isoprenylcysteine carboxylmethyltransferase family protein [Rhodospirillaceae bacterium]|nr:isoprenylcysteine carboxylmethyltransferase family protein [Rhodospirillaceae bacterium]MBL6931226.1 isoprenylcysteine carboxylmethyltransferase family protein [Rhodospirillales bacterium]